MFTSFIFKEETNPMYSSHLRHIGNYRKAIQVFQFVSGTQKKRTSDSRVNETFIRQDFKTHANNVLS